jgi:hypothetical protein
MTDYRRIKPAIPTDVFAGDPERIRVAAQVFLEEARAEGRELSELEVQAFVARVYRAK